MAASNAIHAHDPIQVNLDQVTSKLARPHFLSTLTPSRLPSQVVSEVASDCGSLSPPHLHPALIAPADSQQQQHQHQQHQQHPLHQPRHAIEHIDLVAPLIQDPPADDPADDPSATASVAPHVHEHLESRFVKARKAWATMAAEQRNFQPFAHRHQDLVLAVDFNYFGTRMVTAGSDHRLKVWNKKDDAWTLLESWKAHDAEIVDVKWNGPFMGEVIGSIGEDGRCKLWQEDPTEVSMSGNRFKLITNLGSTSPAPFMSLDFKNIMQETWLALITRDGYLSVYEPVDQSSLNEWTLLAEHWVSQDNPPERQDEVGFKVVFHKEKLPCWTAVMAGLDRKSLSLAVAAMKDVIIYRTDKAKRFWQVARLDGARQIIRDLAWANGSMRGYDVLATASKDGSIRIYEVSTPRSDKSPTVGTPSASSAAEPMSSPQLGRPRKNAPSGISSLAVASKAPEISSYDNEQHPGRIRQVVKMVDELTNHHGAVWRVAFSQMGDLLVSTGDDGSIRTWKKAVNGHWAEYAEIEATS